MPKSDLKEKIAELEEMLAAADRQIKQLERENERAREIYKAKCSLTESLRAHLSARTRVLGEAKEVGIDCAASLAAAISLLERSSPKKAAASDKMFDQMLDDYRASLARFRASQWGAIPRKPMGRE